VHSDNETRQNVKEGTKNEVSFVEIILNSWQFIIVTTRP